MSRLVAPVLFFSHLALFLVVLGNLPDPESGPTASGILSEWRQLAFLIVSSQATLVVLWTGLGPEPFVIRVLCGILLLAFIIGLPVVIDGTEPGAVYAPVVVLVAVPLIVLFRGLNWQLAFRETESGRHSASLSLFLILAAVASFLGVFRERIAWPELWHAFRSQPPDVEQLAPWLCGIALLWVCGVGCSVCTLSARPAAVLYARAWRWMLLCVVVAFAWSYFAIQKNAPVEALQRPVIVRSILYYLVQEFFYFNSLTILTLVLLGQAGWRIAKSNTSDAATDSNAQPYRPLGIHMALLATIVVSGLATIWTGTLDGSYVRWAAHSLFPPSGQVRHVEFHQVHDTTLERLSTSSALTKLTLRDGELSTNGLSHLRKLPQLDQLALHDVKIEQDALVELAHLKSLSSLYVERGNIDGRHWNHLPMMPNLKQVILSDIGVSDEAAAALLAKTPAVETLCLVHLPIGDSTLERVAKLRKLKHLDISRTSVSRDGLDHLEGLDLERLTMSLQPRDDDLLRRYLRVVQPPETHVFGSFDRWPDVTDRGLAFIAPTTRKLTLNGASFTDDGLLQLRRLEQLEELNLNGIQATAAGLETITEFSRLRRLEIYNVPLDDEQLTWLADIDGLEHLTLWRTGVTDSFLPITGRLRSLKTLTLAYNPLTSEGLAALKDLKPGVSVYLVGTTITSAAIENLRRMLPENEIIVLR